ncbi:ZapG family protein [Pleionea sediminis]|uniref:ZapG family protein n=1 Tax=Pleionea sediminis TaxID=2569479 RepID=UPI00118539B4|nr:DUF1043 family protein [Pleionea sediminis]
MEWIAGLLILAATAAIAYTFGKNQAPAQQKIDELENVIIEKDTELQQYRQRVSYHFEKTAQLFGKVTENYQELYQHMAQSSEHLIGAQPFKNAMEHKPTTPEIENEFRGEDTFSSEQYYHAHDYRNQEKKSSESENEEPTAKAEIPQEELAENADNVIQLGKQGEQTGERPLDYAVKEKGVINHNSLNMDNVKT